MTDNIREQDTGGINIIIPVKEGCLVEAKFLNGHKNESLFERATKNTIEMVLT